MASKTATRKSTRGEYIETDTGNKISRRSRIEGTPHIVLAGRVVVQADACLRGDLCRLSNDAAEAKNNSNMSISVGRYTMISSAAVLHPPHRIFKGDLTYYPMRIGDNVFVGSNAFISAASIGSNVLIERDVIIGNGCILKDFVKILEGSVLAAGMVVPSFMVVGGVPARILDELPDGWGAGTPSGGSLWVEGGELRELIRSVK